MASKRVPKRYKGLLSDWLKTQFYCGPFSHLGAKIVTARLRHSGTSLAPDNSQPARRFINLHGLPYCQRHFGASQSAERKDDVPTYLPQITIVTVSFNDDNHLEGCIKSVLLQDYPNLQYIIVDLGSTDTSLEIIDTYQDDIMLLQSKGCTEPASAINMALEHATGKLFNWLNPSDRLAPKSLFKCALAYDKDSSAAGWVGAMHFLDQNGIVIKTIYPNGVDRTHIASNWNGGQFYQASCFLSTKALRKAGPINPHLNQAFDLDIWLRLLESGRFAPANAIWSLAIRNRDDRVSSSERYFQKQHDALKAFYDYHYTVDTDTRARNNTKDLDHEFATEIDSERKKKVSSRSQKPSSLGNHIHIVFLIVFRG